MSSLITTWLNNTWQTLEESRAPTAISDWLLEPASMTQRFEQFCHQITVEVSFEGFINAATEDNETALLPQTTRFWLREITLKGDGIPWLLGRTLIPESSLTVENSALTQLGSQPLGRLLFGDSTLTRDLIQVSQQDALWARRSRLFLRHQPLLLTEVFLCKSPVYRDRRKP